jgi:hypothetical protein
MSIFCMSTSHGACLASSSCCAIRGPQAGLVDVLVTYLASRGYFLARRPVLLNGCPSEKPMLKGGPKCTVYLALSRTLSVLTLPS